MISIGEIQQFILSLSQYSGKNMFNPWADTDEDIDNLPDAWINRQLNLRDHLRCDAKYMLIGEAPGYQGCRYTGIPFTSERLLVEGKIPRLEYHKGIRITTRSRPWSEPSATIVWGALKDLGIEHETILWNAFPFHPHNKDKPLSNRTPTRDEVNDGDEYMVHLRQLHPNATIIAVGNTSHEMLCADGWKNIEKIRHPANGGATKFRKQLSEIISNDITEV